MNATDVIECRRKMIVERQNGIEGGGGTRGRGRLSAPGTGDLGLQGFVAADRRYNSCAVRLCQATVVTA
jgi:hypothetical protein